MSVVNEEIFKGAQNSIRDKFGFAFSLLLNQSRKFATSTFLKPVVNQEILKENKINQELVWFGFQFVVKSVKKIDQFNIP